MCQWIKKIKDAVMYGWGKQTFPKSPKENKHSLNVSTASLFKKIDAAAIQSVTVYKTVYQ